MGVLSFRIAPFFVDTNHSYLPLLGVSFPLDKHFYSSYIELCLIKDSHKLQYKGASHDNDDDEENPSEWMKMYEQWMSAVDGALKILKKKQTCFVQYYATFISSNIYIFCIDYSLLAFQELSFYI